MNSNMLKDSNSLRPPSCSASSLSAVFGFRRKTCKSTLFYIRDPGLVQPHLTAEGIENIFAKREFKAASEEGRHSRGAYMRPLKLLSLKHIRTISGCKEMILLAGDGKLVCSLVAWREIVGFGDGSWKRNS
jgi:hypothetical protein